MSGATFVGSKPALTTDWDDIQRRIGNLPPLEEQPGLEPWTAPQPDPDPIEEEELARIRRERLDELKSSGGGHLRFGKVTPLKVEDYTKEVNQAEDGVAVVLFLYKPRHYLCAYTLVLLEALAKKFGDVKFLQIESNECIPGYPDANLPTLLCYRDDDLVGQCVGATAFGGTSFAVDDIEWELAQMGVLQTEMTLNPHPPGQGRR